jgi:hypothetical protein
MMLESLYVRFFVRLTEPPMRGIMFKIRYWLWVRIAVMIQIRKHMTRGNWRQGIKYLRLL